MHSVIPWGYIVSRHALTTTCSGGSRKFVRGVPLSDGCGLHLIHMHAQGSISQRAFPPHLLRGSFREYKSERK